MSKRKKLSASYEISKVFTFELNGYAQKVLIEGRKMDLPVVICLHGGPGSPLPFSVGSRGLLPMLTDNFVMVYWDQLGCGINAGVKNITYTLDLFVKMTIDLVKEIKLLFPNNKVYFLATSWGSLLSINALKVNPKLVDGVVAWGQIAKDCFINEKALKALEESKLPRDKLKEIRLIDKNNFTSEQMKLVATSLKKYTNAYINKDAKKSNMLPLIFGIMTSPDYKFKDFRNALKNDCTGNSDLFKEILNADVTEDLKSVQVPYLIIQGESDLITDTEMIMNLVNSSKNKYLYYEMVEKMGHIPDFSTIEQNIDKLKIMTK